MPELPPIENGVPIDTSIQVQASIEDVWALLADLPRQPEWMRDALEVRVEGDGEIGVGTTMQVPTQILFLRTTDRMEITRFDPPRVWTVRHTGLVTGEGEFRLHERDGGTLVEWHETLAAPLGWLGRLGMTLFRPVLRWQFASDLERFRQICERESLSPAA